MRRSTLLALSLIFYGCANNPQVDSTQTPNQNENIKKTTQKKLSDYDREVAKYEKIGLKPFKVAPGAKVVDLTKKTKKLPAYMDKRISLNVKNMSYDKFIEMLSLMSGVSITLDRNIKQPVSIIVKNETLKNILDKVTIPYGFEYDANKDGVFVKTYETKILKLYIPASIRKASTTLNTNSNSGGDDTQTSTASLSISNSLDVDIWQEVGRTINSIISDEEKTNVNINYTLSESRSVANNNQDTEQNQRQKALTAQNSTKNVKSNAENQTVSQQNNLKKTDGIPVRVRGIDLNKVYPQKDIASNKNSNKLLGNVKQKANANSLTNNEMLTKSSNVNKNMADQNTVSINKTISMSYNYQPFVQINKLSGLIVVRARPRTVKKIEEYVNNLNKILNKEILIELEIVEFQNNSSTQVGINWNRLLHNVNLLGGSGSLQISQSLGTLTNSGINMVYNGGDFNAVIAALKQQGKVKIISTPRITTLNNQPAMIKVGNDRMIIYTQATTTTTDNGDNTDTTTDNTDTTEQTTIEVTKTPIVSEGLTLYVLPRYNEYTKETILNIVPIIQKLDGSSRDTLDQQLQQMVIADPRNFQTSPIPINVAIKQLNAIAKLKNNQMLILGGLSYNIDTTNENKVPLLGDMPIIGNLFKYKSTGNTKSYLLFLIKVKTF